MAQLKTANAISTEMVDKFRQIDCANVADILKSLGLNCVVQGLHPLQPDSKICGPAMTMRLIPIQDPRLWDKQETSIVVLIEQAAPGTVIVIDAGGRLDVAGGMGGNAAIMAKRHQIEGVVVDGACRDSDGIVEVGMPTFVRGVTLPHSHGVSRSTCVNTEPVQLGSPPAAISVGPGDLVIGDKDGIVVVPASRAEEILALASERQEVDTKMHEFFASGGDRNDPRFKELRSRSKRLEGLSSGRTGPE